MLTELTYEHRISIGQGSENREQNKRGLAERRGFEEREITGHGKERTLLACEHGVEVWAA